MRLTAPLLLAALLPTPALAQTPPSIGPNFRLQEVRAENFDAVFNTKVTMTPATDLLLGQPAQARFDAVICNVDMAGEGWVRVSPRPEGTRTGTLKAGECTLFAGFQKMALTPVDIRSEWTARVFLRSARQP
ncbi:MAG TPA: hypothetical protein VFV70_11500 [Hyphomonadaceae bacterium]|nr:hypothetical protein [Hyphomonadaceae bacterium]